MPCNISTCWNSTFDMLYFAIKYHTTIDSLTSNHELNLRKCELEDCHRLDFPTLQFPSAPIVPFLCPSSPLSFQSFVLPHCFPYCVLFLQYLSIVPLLSYCPFPLSYCHLLYIVLPSFLSLKSNRFQSFFLVSPLVDSQSTSCYRLYASF